MSWISETCCNLLYSWGRISRGKFQERSAVAFSNDCSRWAGGISVRKVSDAAPPSTSRNSAFSSDVGLYVTTMFCLSIYLIVSPYVVCCACLLLARAGKPVVWIASSLACQCMLFVYLSLCNASHTRSRKGSLQRTGGPSRDLLGLLLQALSCAHGQIP